MLGYSIQYSKYFGVRYYCGDSSQYSFCSYSQYEMYNILRVYSKYELLLYWQHICDRFYLETLSRKGDFVYPYCLCCRGFPRAPHIVVLVFGRRCLVRLAEKTKKTSVTRSWCDGRFAVVYIYNHVNTSSVELFDVLTDLDGLKTKLYGFYYRPQKSLCNKTRPHVIRTIPISRELQLVHEKQLHRCIPLVDIRCGQ